ncbi:DUF3859 domain-containing protein [Salipiger mucosus]|uniref:DUF3859 domain-containing protein n=1 Tax=Salipiger mucosus DSM 16094 TaxID=1123237 RepID=S9QLB2_9RHOB|nr:DUF3859 domain-containing protein [Salipiger mucosus]EPX82246.1 hypothetical protein Salmuc_03033 [Salipiger mucosus DSM 16094]
MIRRAAALLLPILLAGLPALAEPPRSFTRDPVVLVDHGIICQTTPEGAREAPDTLAGHINLIRQSQDMDITTRVVPAKLGISFGVKFMLAPGSGSQQVQVVVRHPPMGPEGIERESWTATPDETGPSLNLFSFEHPFEMQPGPWSFTLLQEGEVLMEQHFEVVSELAAPAVLSACYGQDFVS